MSTTWKTVRVFISSTFRDMQAERDWLVKRVFPALRQRLEPHRIHLVDIDLRWGITRQQADNDQVLGLCLQQIDECRPFFLGLLGGRYGWVPSKFPAEVGTRYGWTQHHTGKSVTELEILHGVLNDPAMHGRALFCFRADSFLHEIREKEKRRVYVEVPTRDELNELGWRKAKQRSKGHRKQLGELKKTIRSLSPPMPLFDGYPCQWSQTLPDPVSKTPGRLDGLKEFGNWLIEKLAQAILRAPELQEHVAGARAATRDELAEERDFHEQFIENRTRVYIGRQQLQDELKAFATGAETKPCLVTGPSGSGKSAALAKFVQIARSSAFTRPGEPAEAGTPNASPSDPSAPDAQPSIIVISHFVGASPRSTSLREMLRHLCAELKEALKLEDEIKQDVRELSDQFREFLVKVPDKLPKGHRVLLVLDALNQLDETDNAHSLHWLPMQIPSAVRLIVSGIDDPDRPDQPALAAMRRHAPHEIKVGLLTDDERLGIVREIPSVAAKTLDETQVRLLLDNEATRNPLFLLVALEELRGFGSFDELNRKIAGLPQTGDTLTAIFQQVIRRLGEDFNAVTVKEVLTLLACSRRGLSERELLDLLEGGQVGIEASAGDLFPILRQLRPYLQSRGPLLDFYHRHLAKATHEEFFEGGDTVQRNTHQRLAGYFEPHSLTQRSVDEGPWQLASAREWSLLHNVLRVPAILDALCEASETDIVSYWRQLEQNSEFRILPSYKLLLSEPQPHKTILRISSLLRSFGHLAFALDIIQALIDGSLSAGDTANFAYQLRRLADGMRDLGRLEDAAATYFASERLSRRQGDDAGLVECLVGRSNLLRILGRHQEVRGLLAEAETICQGTALSSLHISVLNVRAGSLADQGQIQEAMDAYRSAEAQARLMSDTRALAGVLCGQGSVLFAEGRLADALARFEEAQDVIERFGTTPELAICLGNRANIYAMRGETSRAVELGEAKVRLCRDMGDTVNLQFGLGTLALALDQVGRTREAQQALAEQERLCRAHGIVEGMQLCLANQAAAAGRAGDYPAALALQRERERVCRDAGLRGPTASSLTEQAISLMNTGELDIARRYTRDAISIYQDLADQMGIARNLGTQGQILARRHDFSWALAKFRDQEVILRGRERSVELLRCLSGKGTVLAGLGHTEDAVAVLTEAQSIAREFGLQSDSKLIGSFLDRLSSST